MKIDSFINNMFSGISKESIEKIEEQNRELAYHLENWTRDMFEEPRSKEVE